MAEHTLTRLRSRSGYSDTAAVDDIHALITRTEYLASDELAAIAEIIERTGRPLVAGRDIEVTTTETALGWPVICLRSGDVTVTVRQELAGAGLRVEITTATQAERNTLAVTLDGQLLACP